LAPVRTFEIAADRALPFARDETMAAASTRLVDGAYTKLRTYGRSRLLRLVQHVRRLEESAALQGQPGPLDIERARLGIRTALEATAHSESRLRLTFSPPRLFISVEAFEPLPQALYEGGAACVTVPLRRPNPHAKDTRFIAAATSAYQALPDGVEEGLMVADDGSLLEGLSSNFFAAVDGVLFTEEDRVLLGVTRALVLEVALGILPVRRQAVRHDQLPAVTECFITSVSREVLPVVRIDGRPILDGRPGPNTRAIQAAFASLVEREAEAV
jgi:branched-chain amino acid aminotransferase